MSGEDWLGRSDPPYARNDIRIFAEERLAIDVTRLRSRCPGHIRHWFAPYGMPTVVRPTCVRCGAPNPKWTPEKEAEMRQMMGDEFVEEMLAERGSTR